MAETAERLRRTLETLPGALLEGHVADFAACELPAGRPPWLDTGLHLREGDAFSVFAAGRVVLSEEAGLWNGPRFHLWARVAGRAPLLNGGQDTWTFRAPHDGELELGLVQGEWATRDGAIDPAPYAALQGGIDALVVLWKGDAAAGIAALAEAAPDEPLFAAERTRLANPIVRPEGWEYLWFLGEADIFSSSEHDGRPAIRARTKDDVGILQRPVDLPFAPDSRLSWEWRVTELPSERAEDSLLTHDYLSLAVEFENGQDLTYYWSSELPPGTHYRCPLPAWDQRETHWVVRSGSAGLGEWHAEERPLHDDYRAAVGVPPRRIVGVWLIAVSIFQKGSGAAEFAGVELVSGGERVRVI
jgi:hypothetical protein